MARENPTWGQPRVAAELSVKLGIYVLSPRTVRNYWPSEPNDEVRDELPPSAGRRLSAITHQSVVGCDFIVVVTARFRILYVFLLMEVRTRRHPALQSHRAPNGGVDLATVSGGDFLRSLPLPHSRPRLHLFGAGRRPAQSIWASRVAHARASTAGECPLRTAGRNSPPRVPGFRPDPTGRDNRFSKILTEWVPITTEAGLIRTWGLAFRTVWRCSCLYALHHSICLTDIRKVALVRSSAGSTVNTAGKGWPH